MKLNKKMIKKQTKKCTKKRSKKKHKPSPSLFTQKIQKKKEPKMNEIINKK